MEGEGRVNAREMGRREGLEKFSLVNARCLGRAGTAMAIPLEKFIWGE